MSENPAERHRHTATLECPGIKNPMESGDAATHNHSNTHVGSVKGLTQNWQKWSGEHQEYQKRNPFSCSATPPERPQLFRDQEDYGRPEQGSKTEQRGQDAHTHVHREVQELCQVIRDIGERRGDGTAAVEFGTLFEHYVPISNKLVGVLLRARRQGLVQFEGEMLWQGRDDRVLISLL